MGYMARVERTNLPTSDFDTAPPSQPRRTPGPVVRRWNVVMMLSLGEVPRCLADILPSRERDRFSWRCIRLRRHSRHTRHSFGLARVCGM
jgi:hypothetical protein